MKVVIFKPTYRCNLKCTYCYERDNRDAEKPLEFTQEESIYALEKLISMYPEEAWEVIWHGGEPSIVGLDYVKNVINYFENKPYVIKWAFQSNGTLLTDEWLDFFLEKGIFIGTSWDGFDNNVTRQSQNFFDLVERAHRKKVGVGAIFTMTPNNIDKLIPSYQYAQDHGIDMVFNTAFKVGLSEKDHVELANKLIELFDYICISETPMINRPFNEIISYIKGEESFYCEGKNCVGSWFGIHPDGDIYSCGKPWDKETCIGNVFKDKDLKTTTENSEFRQILRKVRLQQLDECKNCRYVMLCRGRCPFTGFEGKVYHKDFAQCAFYKTLYDGCLSVLHKHLENHTLTNIELIKAVNLTCKTEFKKWKNYKSPLMEI